MSQFQTKAEAIRRELSKRIVGQERIIEDLLISFFAGGHCLLIGVPGLAKTLLIRSFAETIGLSFNRIQFTPDLMPSDITGTDVIGERSGSGERRFLFLNGPIFSNVVLADEINRTPPKTQSALLEAMEEGQVSVTGKQYPLPQPFFVMATQNPIEQEGTYTLPLAALDRFLFTILVDYPSHDHELMMLFQTTSQDEQPLNQVLTLEEVQTFIAEVKSVEIQEDVLKYATQLVRGTRPKQSKLPYIQDMVEIGASPRALQALILGAKSFAALQGRKSVQGSDIRRVTYPTLRHRIVPSFHANADGIEANVLIDYLLAHIPRPSGDVETISKKKSHFNLFQWLLGKPKPRRRKEPSLL